MDGTRQRRLWLLVSAAWIAPAVFGAVNEVAQGRLHGDGAVSVGAILFGAGDWLIYGALTPAVLMAAQRWPLARPHLRLHGGGELLRELRELELAALQHLVENAVRHGIARRPEGGEVAVSARRRGDGLELVVADDGAGLAGEPDRAGHGLENTRQRLRALYGERASLSVEPRAPRGVEATLRLPWHEVEPRGSLG